MADLILEQKHRHHLANAEIAILYRTNAQSRKFEEHLRRLNLPYRIFGGMSFYQRKEVKDFVAYLRLAVNPLDEEALRRVINYPARGISAATVDKLFKECEANEGYRLAVDLESQKVTTPSGESFAFDITPHRKHCLLNGLDEIGLTLQHADEIKAFEAKHKAAQPWLFA